MDWLRAFSTSGGFAPTAGAEASRQLAHAAAECKGTSEREKNDSAAAMIRRKDAAYAAVIAINIGNARVLGAFGLPRVVLEVH